MPCLARNAMRLPSRVPITMGADGFPKGVSKSFSILSDKPAMLYKPDPPMIARDRFSVIKILQINNRIFEHRARRDCSNGVHNFFVGGTRKSPASEIKKYTSPHLNLSSDITTVRMSSFSWLRNIPLVEFRSSNHHWL